MKTLSAIIFILTLSATSFGQTLTKEGISGKWEVGEIIQQPTNPQFAPLIDGFKSATFYFNPNGNFELTSTSKSELFGMFLQMTNGTKWVIEKDKDKRLVRIGNKEKKFSTVGILVKEIDGKKVFEIEESGIIFEVKKI